MQRDQLRRLAVLEPEEDFGEAIGEAERRCVPSFALGLLGGRR